MISLLPELYAVAVVHHVEVNQTTQNSTNIVTNFALHKTVYIHTCTDSHEIHTEMHKTRTHNLHTNNTHTISQCVCAVISPLSAMYAVSIGHNVKVN